MIESIATFLLFEARRDRENVAVDSIIASQVVPVSRARCSDPAGKCG
jgi:hypothetical protein